MSEPTQYRCTNRRRADLVEASATINGIDFLEVLDRQLPVGSSLRQKVLLVHLFKPIPSDIGPENVRIRGGVRIKTVSAIWALPATTVTGGTVPANEPDPIAFAELVALLNSIVPAADMNRVLVVRTDSNGDFSPYELALTDDTGENLPSSAFDPQLSRVTFSFKVECPSDFDCRTDDVCPPEILATPAIDYLAKDYDSFRALMLDRMALTMPGWRESNPADATIAVVEILAYAADHASYFQDAVSTEAYLGTARLRQSMRRHARLLDYTPREGSNARVFVRFEVEVAGADEVTLPIRTPIVTKIDAEVLLTEEAFEAAVDAGAQVFQTMHDLVLRPANNAIDLHTWGDLDCCLPKGATRATLADRDVNIELAVGDLIAFVELVGPESGLTVDADPSHRHVVRLTSVKTGLIDPVMDPPLPVIEIEWSAADALPFALCVTAQRRTAPVSQVWGNIVICDHGRSVEDDPLVATTSAPGAVRLRLSQGPLTHQGQVTNAAREQVPVDPAAPAADVFKWNPREVRPAIDLYLHDDATGCDPGADHPEHWEVRRDLLASDSTDPHFVVETDNAGSAELRFGDGVFGREPDADLRACYRIGNGTGGNLGADTLQHVFSDVEDVSFVSVTNPLPALGGAEPEPLEEIRLAAPQAFRVQERAVTEADYAAIALRHPEIQRAVATFRFTGSWYTVFITIDRQGGLPVDAEFEQRFRDFIERFRLAGYDIEVDGAIPVPLDIILTVCVRPGFFRSTVKQSLLQTFSSGVLPDGQLGFFHADNFTFGQPVFLSKIFTAALAVPGVASIETRPGSALRFQRLEGATGKELDDGFLRMSRLEVAQLDNDPSQPENGKLQFVMEGGL